MRIVYDSMQKLESTRRVIDRAVIDKPVVLPFKGIMSNGAVNALRQRKGFR